MRCIPHQRAKLPEYIYMTGIIAEMEVPEPNANFAILTFHDRNETTIINDQERNVMIKEPSERF